MRSAGVKRTWGQWLDAQMRNCGFHTDDALARRIGVDNATVSRWKADKIKPTDIGKLRAMVEPLRTDLMTLLVVSGLLDQREIDGRAGRVEPLTTRELLANDPALPDIARRMLLAAYDAAHEERPGLRAVSRRQRQEPQ